MIKNNNHGSNHVNFRICLSWGSSKRRTEDRDSVLVLYVGGECRKRTGGSGDSDRGRRRAGEGHVL